MGFSAIKNCKNIHLIFCCILLTSLFPISSYAINLIQEGSSHAAGVFTTASSGTSHIIKSIKVRSYKNASGAPNACSTLTTPSTLSSCLNTTFTVNPGGSYAVSGAAVYSIVNDTAVDCIRVITYTGIACSTVTDNVFVRGSSNGGEYLHFAVDCTTNPCTTSTGTFEKTLV